MKTYLRFSTVTTLLVVFVLAISVGAAAPSAGTSAGKPPTATPGGPTPTPGGAANTISVSGTQWGISACYLGATEGNVRFNAADLTDAGMNTYRVYGGMSRWEKVDDDGVYGSPTIAQIKANVNSINWAFWDNVMTNPDSGSDYSWSGTPGTTWQGNARTLFQGLKDAGIRTVLTVRNVDNNTKPDWAEANLNPPNTPEDWNEWWEHVFATAYWLNVRNNYMVDDYEVHNEPNNAGQGFNGTLADYRQLVIQTNDALQYVYATYLPGRTPRVYAPVSNNTSWPLDMMQTVPTHFTRLDWHNYSSNISGGVQELHGYMNANGFANNELWLSEWATYRGGYDGFSLAINTVINNLIRGSRPGNDHVDGSHLFTFYDWDGFSGGFQNFEGLVDINGNKRNTYYGFRLASRGLTGCRPTFQSTASNSNLMAITTKDAANAVYLLVTNSSSGALTVDANLSALKMTGTGTQWEFSAAHLDTIVATPSLSAGHVVFTIPGNAAVLLKF